MTNETGAGALVMKELNELAALPEEITKGGWGAAEDIDSTDLTIPKIYHQQAISAFVREEKARPGDFCDSLTGEVIAKKIEKLELIVFKLVKTMVISKLEEKSNKYKYEKTLAITPANAVEMSKKPFFEDTDEGKIKNSLTYNFYCLVPGRMELPYVLSMASTKTKVARNLSTLLTKLEQAGQPGASVVFEIRNLEESNDDGDWYNFSLSQGRNATAAELKAAHDWYVRSKTQKFVVNDEQAEDDSAGSDQPHF